VDAAAGQVITARFRFLMPALLSGEYTLDAAIATGTQDNHIQHHFLHDAAVVVVHSPLNLGAVLAVPVEEITLRAEAS
jgi:lipopolysaccharide transport system ATP-binding protein